jgi:hypothetical protein
MKTFLLTMGMVVGLTAAGSAMASDPTGIYARIDKVVLEPNGDNPERIQVWGTFALAKKNTRNDYEKPVRGYLYYSLDKKKEEMCRQEWADLKKLAGTDQCVAFGARYKPMGTVRKTGDKPKNPETYPIGFGLVKVEASNPQAKALKDKTIQ